LVAVVAVEVHAVAPMELKRSTRLLPVSATLHPRTRGRRREIAGLSAERASITI
jgi:hypothetical protein